MNVYYELADSALGPKGKYFVARNMLASHTIQYLNLMQRSQRVWCEDKSGVRFIKNRFEDMYDTCGYGVDVEEFLMVKLSAEAV